MTRDQLRRSIRAELQAARCRDGDQSEVRLWHDARKLDARMTEAGFPPGHPTTWGTNPATVAYGEAYRRAKKAAVLGDQPPTDTEVPA